MKSSLPFLIMSIDFAQLKLLLNEGEGLTVEFKEKYTPKIDRDIVALANARGGVILLGVDDDGHVEKTVEKTVEKIWALIRENPGITQNDIILITGLTRRGVEWNIKKLKDRGVLRRVGPDKGGSWEIIDDLHISKN